MFVAIWEFVAATGREREFERAYGKDGDWAVLFREADGFLGTELLRDESNPRRYVTVDRWESREAYEQFRAENDREYRALDLVCEKLTEHESWLGSFVS